MNLLHRMAFPALTLLFLAWCGCITSGKPAAGGAKVAEAQTPREKTEQTFDEIRDAVVAYSHRRGKPPASLGTLQGRWDSEKVRDGWGNNIAYAVGTDSTVRLWSFGSDNAIGGTGDAADIVVAFQPFSPPTTTASPLVSTPMR